MNSEELAWKIRRHGVEMTHRSGGSHIGAILSVADIIAVLYADVMHYRTNEPTWDGRDRIILSKGHAGAAIYAALAEAGFFSVEELLTHYADGSRLSGHVSHHVPGVDFSTGSLGHGLSVGCGMAYVAKKDKKEHRVFVVLGDGECNEGSVWEAALFANQFRLSHLVAIVDNNRMESMDFTENTLGMEDFAGKWRAFGWNVIQIDGNNHEALKKAFREAEANGNKEPHKPTVILADTIKGYGVSFMQNNILWHYRFPHDGWEYDGAVNDLQKIKPAGVDDPYTPEGIRNPKQPQANDDVRNDHTLTYTWRPNYSELVRRVEAETGTPEKVHAIVMKNKTTRSDL